MPPWTPAVSIELLPDAAGEDAMRAEWAALEGAGIANAGRHPGSTNRPHLSIAIRSELGDPEPLRNAAGRLPLSLRLGGLLIFLHRDRVVLSRAVVADAALLDMHAQVHGLCAGWGEALPNSAPGAWSPHLTLARRLRREELPGAIAALGSPPEHLVVDRLRVWDGGRREVTALYSGARSDSGSV